MCFSALFGLLPVWIKVRIGMLTFWVFVCLPATHTWYCDNWAHFLRKKKIEKVETLENLFVKHVVPNVYDFLHSKEWKSKRSKTTMDFIDIHCTDKKKKSLKNTFFQNRENHFSKYHLLSSTKESYRFDETKWNMTWWQISFLGELSIHFLCLEFLCEVPCTIMLLLFSDLYKREHLQQFKLLSVLNDNTVSYYPSLRAICPAQTGMNQIIV